MIKVDYEQLEPSDDHLVLVYEEMPFTGIALEKSELGQMLTETSFVNGQRNGISKEWSDSNVLIREQHFVFDALHGQARQWHDNGQIWTEGLYELGICLHEKEWNECGEIVRDYQLNEACEQFRTLLLLRSSTIGQKVERGQI